MRIKQKTSNATGRIPTSADLSLGEIAVNIVDSKLHIKDNLNNIVEHNAWEPKLYEVADVAARDALTMKNGQYCYYHNGTNDQLDMWLDGQWWKIEEPASHT